MTNNATDDWAAANQRYLVAALHVVRLLLQRHIAHARDEDFSDAQISGAREELPRMASTMNAPPAIEALHEAFGLSSFERDLLLLCAGIEMDSRFVSLCAAAQDDAARPYPTFSLALAALEDAHWSALSPTRPLRNWRLIEIGAGGTLTTSPLRIDEHILNYLAGVHHLDERLMGMIEPLDITDTLVPSHQKIAEQVAAAWKPPTAVKDLPLVQLCGSEAIGKRAIAASACAALKMQLWVMSAHVVPTTPGEMDNLLRLWKREAALTKKALLIEGDDEVSDPARLQALTQLIERAFVPLIVASRDRIRIRHRASIAFDINKPTASEQRDIWLRVLGGTVPNIEGHLDHLVSQFNLGPQLIQAASAEALGRISASDATPPESAADKMSKQLWAACRAQARARMDDLAQRLEPVARWQDIVLPEAQENALREIAMHVRQRARVYEEWGFAEKGTRGLGISALFAGTSGTGKTMAAEVLANELELDLFRIDLSAVVSKYIGETEKNLRRVFDAAEAGGAVLLFDEADALFGKRTEVKDSHDRYANIEVSYLLQRMEEYRGLAILTTNLKNALDSAFVRRLRFIIQFPFPDAAQRAEIWKRIFPEKTLTEGLDATKLAQLNVAGGNIRNVAMHAAFMAADAGEPVRMEHLLKAARREYAKLEKPVSEVEIKGWSEERREIAAEHRTTN